MSALLAARLNVARAGGDLRVLDGLHAEQLGQATASANSRANDVIQAAETDEERLQEEKLQEARAARPFAAATR
jgi:hypothetical protein